MWRSVVSQPSAMLCAIYYRDEVVKLKPITVILLITAIAFGGIVYFVEIRGSSQEQTVGGTVNDLFAFEEGDVQSFTLTTQLTQDEPLQFERDDEDLWQMREPEQTEASPASIAFLLNLLSTASSDRTVTVSTEDWQAFGFHQPLAIVEVTLEDGTTHTLMLGEYDFERSAIYARIDSPTDAPPDTDEMDVLLVTPEFENAVSRPFDEWLQPEEPDNATDQQENPPEFLDEGVDEEGLGEE